VFHSIYVNHFRLELKLRALRHGNTCARATRRARSNGIDPHEHEIRTFCDFPRKYTNVLRRLTRYIKVDHFIISNFHHNGHCFRQVSDDTHDYGFIDSHVIIVMIHRQQFFFSRERRKLGENTTNARDKTNESQSSLSSRGSHHRNSPGTDELAHKPLLVLRRLLISLF